MFVVDGDGGSRKSEVFPLWLYSGKVLEEGKCVFIQGEGVVGVLVLLVLMLMMLMVLVILEWDGHGVGDGRDGGDDAVGGVGK